MIRHVVELEADMIPDRTNWHCECGAAGSAPTPIADSAAEKHVREDEPVTYRYQVR